MLKAMTVLSLRGRLTRRSADAGIRQHGFGNRRSYHRSPRRLLTRIGWRIARTCDYPSRKDAQREDSARALQSTDTFIDVGVDDLSGKRLGATRSAMLSRPAGLARGSCSRNFWGTVVPSQLRTITRVWARRVLPAAYLPVVNDRADAVVGQTGLPRSGRLPAGAGITGTGRALRAAQPVPKSTVGLVLAAALIDTPRVVLYQRPLRPGL